MKNNAKLFFLLATIFIIIVSCFAFFYQNKFYKQRTIGGDIDEIKNSFLKAIQFENASIPKLFDKQESVENLKQVIENQIQGQDEKKELGELIEKKIIDELGNSKTEYNYEPWGIKFSYFNDVQKLLDDKNQTIVLKYDDENLLEMKKEIFKEKEFADWLVKHFDIQKLSKENINNLVFWYTESSVDNKLNKNYYINIGKTYFI